ncbi:acyltransferase family protein [Streptomyces sp. NPDC090022]|uniref:acyltransferase family protein n=1 Tax=Streptomyces sp. NPDC090022 TaxID=3365920 RepID=UPI00381F2EA8
MTSLDASAAARDEARSPAGERPGQDPAGGAGGRAGGPPRLAALDGLRLLAALMVAGYHYGGRDGEVARAWGASPRELFPTASGWFAYGCLGVQIFFVISGFVICMSARGRRTRAFAASRAARLYPAYWVAIGLVTLVAYPTVSASDLLVNLTMLQQPLGADRVLGVCWTLWAELRFYVLFALCVVLPGGGRRRTLLFCGGWLFAAALADASDHALLTEALMPQYAPFFVGGIGLYLLHRDRRDALAWCVTGAGWLLGQHYAVAGLWHAPDPRFFSYRSALVIVAVVTAGFLAVALVALGPLGRFGRFGPAGGRWLMAAGALTYPFYLVHEHLGWTVISALGPALPPAVVLVVTVALMLGLAWAVHRLVERPLTPVLRRALS